MQTNIIHILTCSLGAIRLINFKFVYVNSVACYKIASINSKIWDTAHTYQKTSILFFDESNCPTGQLQLIGKRWWVSFYTQNKNVAHYNLVTGQVWNLTWTKFWCFVCKVQSVRSKIVLLCYYNLFFQSNHRNLIYDYFLINTNSSFESTSNRI